MARPLAIPLLLSFTLLLGYVGALDSCSNSEASLYDGYLESFLSFASFDKDQNGYLNIPNPFLDEDSLNSMTITFWVKFPALTEADYNSLGILVDCGDTLELTIQSGIVTFLLSEDQTTTNYQTGSLDGTFAQYDLDQLSEWQSMAFSFSESTQYLFMNGVSFNQVLTFDILGQNSALCSIGNSLDASSPLSIYLRHLMFSVTPWTSSTDTSNLLHHQLMPSTDSGLLAYYAFDSFSGLSNTYYYSGEDTASEGAVLMNSAESEFVCYCTGTYPNYLQVDDTFTFNPITTFTATIGEAGYILEFQIFANLPTIDLPTTMLFEFQDYSQIYLTNNGASLRVDLFELGDTSSPSRSVTFPNFIFRYNVWTDIRISVSTSTVTLTVDGLQINSYSHSVALQEEVGSFSVENPADLSFLISFLTITQGGSRGDEALNQLFDQASLTTEVLATWVGSGTPTFGTNNRQCSYSLQNLQTYWNGLSCEDNRLYSYFNGQTSSGYLSGQLQSSQSTMTIEMWVMDNNNDASTLQVLFENSVDGENPLIQILLLTSSSAADGKSIYCYPSRTTNSEEVVQLEAQDTYQIWTHIACLSDSEALTTSLIAYSDSLAQTNSASLSGSNFEERELAITTSLGSSVSGASQFSGFLREVRIWNSARSDTNLQLYRYQSVDAASSGLSYYFRLSDQINPLELTDAVTGATLTEQTDSPVVSYIDDTLTDDLIMCQVGLYYNLECCESFDISSIDFTFGYDGMYLFRVALDESSMSNQGLYQSMVGTFVVTSVGNDVYAVENDPTITYLNELSLLFNKAGVQEYSVQAVLVNTNIESITLQGTIYSLYDPTQLITLQRTVSVSCPVVFLTVVPNYGTEDPVIVSSTATDKTPSVVSVVDMTCTGASKFTYSWRSDDPDIDLYDLFNVGQVKVSAIEDKLSVLTSDSMLYTLSLRIKNKDTNTYTPDTYISLQFLPISIEAVYDEAQLSQTLEFGETISLDFSDSSTSDSDYPLLYEVTCPSSLFSGDAIYADLCVISSAGQFSLDSSTLEVISDFDYTFTVRLILEGTAIFYDYDAVVNFYKDGGSTNCPQVQLESTYNVPFALQNNYAIYPDVFFYCSGQPFTLSEANWLLVDSLDATDFTYILDYDDQDIPRYANILPANLDSIVSGQILDLTVQFRAISDDGLTQTTTSSFGQIIFSETALEVLIEAQNGDATALTDNTLPFMEEFLILDSSQSYDPNDASAELSYSWTCPVLVTTAGYTCANFVSGTNNQLLTINIYDRINIGFEYNTEYAFIVEASSESNPYKSSNSQSISVVFSPPDSADASNNLEMVLSCSGIAALNGYLTTLDGQSNTLVYDISDYEEANFDVSTTYSSSCTAGTPTAQQMYIYVFGAFFDSTTPMLLLFEQESTIQLNTDNNFVLQDYFDLLTLDYQESFQANLYLFTKTSADDTYTYLDIESIYLYRQPADLVAELSESILSIDKYNNFELDASASFDPEEMFGSYSYIWSCPGTVDCSLESSAILEVTYQMREDGASNTADTSYGYSVVMTDGDRESAPAEVSVTITQQDSYEDCLSLSLNLDDLTGYDSADNVLYLQYQQTDPVTLSMTIQTICDNVNIQDQTYSTQDTSQLVFWETDITDSSSITFTQASLEVLASDDPQLVIFTQDYSLGDDTSSPFSATFEITVTMTDPDIVISILDNRIMYFATSTSTITIDGSATNDPSGDPLVYTWDCPSYFGGDSCSTSNSVVLSYASLAAANSNDLEQYYDQSHLFTMTTTTFEGLREETKSFYLYLVDPEDALFTQTGAASCGIYLSGDTSEKYIPFDTISSFVFDCPADSAVTDSITSGNGLTWAIDALTENVDYFQVESVLYLSAFAGGKLNGATELVISLSIENALSSPLQEAFKVKSTQLDAGEVAVSPATQQAYTQAYALTFSEFASTRGYGIQTQLRGYSPIQNSQVVVYPMSTYSEQVNLELYGSLVLPQLDSLFLDFFDMNANYMGSYDLYAQSFSALAPGTFTQAQFDEVFSTLMAQADLYTSTNEDHHQYIYDIRLLLTYSEAATTGAVELATADLQAYALQAIQFLGSTVSTEMDYFSASGTYFQSEGRIFVLKSCLYILDLMTQTGTDYTTLLNEVISILEMAIAAYEDLEGEGRDQDTLDQSFQSSLASAVGQVELLVQEEGETLIIQQYQARLEAISEALVGADFEGLLEGETSTSFEGTTSQSSNYLDTSDIPLTLTSQLNSNEVVQVDAPTELTSRGASYLQASFSEIEDQDFASTTTIYIDAFDAAFNKVDIDFTTALEQSTVLAYILERHPVLTQDATYLTFSIQAKQEFMELFTETLNDDTLDTYYYPSCDYFDKTQNLWSNEGLTNSSYDYDTGVLVCATTHLSQFAMGSVLLTKSVGGGTGSYFQQTDNVLFYYLGIGGMTVITLATIVVSCLARTDWDAKSPNLDHLRQQNNGCCGACKSAFLLHHLLFSAIIGPAVASLHLTLPKASKMIDFWWLFYAVLAAIGLTMWQRDTVDWALPYQTFDITSTSEIMDQFTYYKHNLILISTIVGGIFIGRIVSLTVGYTLYFMGKGPDMHLKMKDTPKLASVPSSIGAQSHTHTSVVSSEIQSDLEEGLVKKKAKKGKKKKKKKVVKKKLSDQEFEGGSSEDDSQKKKGRKGLDNKKKHRYDNNSGSDHNCDVGDQMRKGGSPQKSTKKVAMMDQTKKRTYNKASDNEGKYSSNEDERTRKRLESNSPGKKTGQNKQDLFVDDHQYMKMSQEKPRNKKQDFPPKKQFQNEPIVEELKEEKKKKKKKRIVKKSRSPSPNRETNHKIQNMSTIESGQEFSANEEASLSIAKKKALGKPKKQEFEVDEDYIVAQYKGGKMITLGIKTALMMGCMGISYWMLWLFEDLSYIYSWLGMTAAVLGIWVLILEPLFTLIFALFFICTKGNGGCIKVAGIILMGNAHQNLVNGILYDMNNNI